jgi:hypothetical protein
MEMEGENIICFAKDWSEESHQQQPRDAPLGPEEPGAVAELDLHTGAEAVLLERSREDRPQGA